MSMSKPRQPYYLEPLAVVCLLRTLRGCVGLGRVMMVTTTSNVSFNLEHTILICDEQAVINTPF